MLHPLYELQFKVLPFIVSKIHDESYAEIFLDEQGLKGLQVYMLDQCHDERKIIPSVHLDNEKALLIVYTFPKQTLIGLCDYIAFYHDRVHQVIRYYTCEVSLGGSHVLGQQNGDLHTNWGCCGDDADSFAQAVLRVEEHNHREDGD